MVSQRFCAALMAEPLGRERYEVVVHGAEALPAYDRVNLGAVLHGQPAGQLTLSDRTWYRRHGIALHLGERVIAIDRAAREISCASGRTHIYDRLVLATGSEPIRPPIPLPQHPTVSCLRTVADAEALRDGLKDARRAVVLGGGLLGIESAWTLRQLGLDVAVIERGDRLMGRQLDAQTAQALRARVAAVGIGVHLEVTATGVRAAPPGAGGRWLVGLDGGRELAADVVLVCVGVRPRDELAVCGLDRHERGGFLVNDRLETSDPAIFAIGECAVLPDQEAPHGTVTPGFAMADALAATLLGRAQPLVLPLASYRLKIPEIPLYVVGRALPAGAQVVRSEGTPCTLHVEAGRLVGAAALGEWNEWEHVEESVRTAAALAPDRLERFARGEPLFPGAPEVRPRTPPPDVAPDDFIVCKCAAVTAGTLRRAVADGCTDLHTLSLRTRAARTCGRCLDDVQRFVTLSPGPQRRRWSRPMLAAVALVPLLLALLVGARPGAAALSGRGRPFAGLDFLWRDPLAQQISGFALLGICAGTLLLSLRRRVGWLPGSPGLWRGVHVGLGLAAMLAIAAHTSLRLGRGFNATLSVAFLALLGLGGAAAVGFVKRALANRPWARGLARIHIAAFWAALGLIAGHILLVYYY